MIPPPVVAPNGTSTTAHAQDHDECVGFLATDADETVHLLLLCRRVVFS